MSHNKTSQENGLARRDFIKTGLAGAAALSLSGLNVTKVEAARTLRQQYASESSFETPDDWKAWAQ